MYARGASAGRSLDLETDAVFLAAALHLGDVQVSDDDDSDDATATGNASNSSAGVSSRNGSNFFTSIFLVRPC